MREVEFKVCNALSRSVGNKGFERDEKLAGCICLGIAERKVHAAGRAGMKNADIKLLVTRGKWRKQGI
jgi:hypothetical protein